MLFKKGDTIRVKPIFIDEDTETDLSGFHGIVHEINHHENDISVEITWDATSLRKLPSEYIRTCEIEGYSWTSYFFLEQDIELVPSQPSDESAEKVIEELEYEHRFDHDGNTEFLEELLGDCDDEYEEFEAWQTFLTEKLKFPIIMKVTPDMEPGRVRVGDEIKAFEIDDLVDDMRGIFVNGKHHTGTVMLPLCDLEVKDKESEAYSLVYMYVVWFANR